MPDNREARGSVLVTGASRGIGRALARLLVSEGRRVTGTCRDPSALGEEDRLPGISWLSLDLADRASVDALVAAAGDTDVLVCNAGMSLMGPGEEALAEKARLIFDVNFFGQARLAQGFLPLMRRRGGGKIIFVGSMRSEGPSPFSSLYSSSKAALRSFAECLRMEVSGFGIQVTVVAPWHVRTDLPQELVFAAGSPYEEALKRVKANRDGKLASGMPPEAAAAAVARIIRNPRPKSFYPLGKPFLSFLTRHMPRSVAEYVSARMFGLSGKGKAVAPIDNGRSAGRSE
jgi:NAD(P)-dependent dehydrogenase (short-subunit alcohol dehydrogenase family)